MYWKNEQTTPKESPSKNTVSVTWIAYTFEMSYCAFLFPVILISCFINESLAYVISIFWKIFMNKNDQNILNL